MVSNIQSHIDHTLFYPIIINLKIKPNPNFKYIIEQKMRNTLPLSSFPLQLLLISQQYYHIVLVALAFFLVLFKTYNLPYTGGMSAQQGIILFIFVGYMQIRIKYGISANKVRWFVFRRKVRIRWHCLCCLHSQGQFSVFTIFFCNTTFSSSKSSSSHYF